MKKLRFRVLPRHLKVAYQGVSLIEHFNRI
jgi:hypothetical protein